MTTNTQADDTSLSITEATIASVASTRSRGLGSVGSSADKGAAVVAGIPKSRDAAKPSGGTGRPKVRPDANYRHVICARHLAGLGGVSASFHPAEGPSRPAPLVCQHSAELYSLESHPPFLQFCSREIAVSHTAHAGYVRTLFLPPGNNLNTIPSAICRCVVATAHARYGFGIALRALDCCNLQMQLQLSASVSRLTGVKQAVRTAVAEEEPDQVRRCFRCGFEGHTRSFCKEKYSKSGARLMGGTHF
jgi:hypothetical protein